jgi:NNP family nitrate/nitrite transporter-like MFS transporter
MIAGLFGLMNIFARTLGGVVGDRAGIKWGLRGRVGFMGGVLLAEGFALMLFSQMNVLAVAIATLVLFSLFVQMAEGATYSVVPFINKKALGSVAGIVGAGGNAGAVAAGFLFRSESLSTQQALFYLGIAVACASSLAVLVRFSKQDEATAREEMNASLVPAPAE